MENNEHKGMRGYCDFDPISNTTGWI